MVPSQLVEVEPARWDALVRGLGVTDVYYTRSWNYSYDDVERGFTGIAYADVNDIRSEYNYSNIDEPHQFIGNVNYSLPLGFL